MSLLPVRSFSAYGLGETGLPTGCRHSLRIAQMIPLLPEPDGGADQACPENQTEGVDEVERFSLFEDKQ